MEQSNQKQLRDVMQKLANFGKPRSPQSVPNCNKNNSSNEDGIFHKWNFLPNEMKMECINRMGFKSRIHLRRTCRTEKGLVDARRYKFDFVKIYCMTDPGQPSILDITAQNRLETIFIFSDNFFKRRNLSHKEAYCMSISAAVHILKQCSIGELHVECNLWSEETNLMIHELSKCAPFYVSIFFSSGNNPKSIPMFFLNNIKNKLNLVHFNTYGTCELPLNDLVSLPNFVGAEQVQISSNNLDNLRKAPIAIVEKWLENNVENGREAIVDFSRFPELEQTPLPEAETMLKMIASKYESFIVYKSPVEVRIRTNYAEKQILFKVHFIGGLRISCLMIPANLKISDYKKKSGWTDKLLKEENFRYYLLE